MTKKEEPGNYICPSCTSRLSVAGYIILTARTKKGQRGLVLLSAEMGDYTVEKHPDFEIAEGEVVDFFCPVCHHDCKYPDKDELAMLIHRDPAGEEHTILFSRIRGEHYTLELQKESAVSYGEHAMRYQDPEWFLRQHE